MSHHNEDERLYNEFARAAVGFPPTDTSQRPEQEGPMDSPRHFPNDNCGDPNHDAILTAWYARANELLDAGLPDPLDVFGDLVDMAERYWPTRPEVIAARSALGRLQSAGGGTDG